jgi:glyoxylase-like metal-dependent hydrolase (beta-lactamase superfamily II)
MIEIITLEVSPFQQNCRLLIDKATSQAVVVDPGGDGERIISELKKRALRCTEVWLTHSHLDHCGAVVDLKEEYNCMLRAHPAEQIMRAKVEEIAAMYGLPAGTFKNCPEPDSTFEGGEVLHFAGLDFEVRFTPGHSPGHVVFYCKKENVLLAGDTLFAGSIGRTDLPGGNHRQLMESIKKEILCLPESVRVLPGHGPDTDIGTETSTNPFLN